MSGRWAVLRVVLAVLVSCCLPAVRSVASSSANPLGPYSISDVTVSGLSSGGYMAVQLHVALSSLINGSAVFAGGPYFCAEGSAFLAEYKCMKNYFGVPDVGYLVGLTNSYSLYKQIDKVSNLQDDHVYIFSGEEDTVVDTEVVHALQSYYGFFARPENIAADYHVQAEHLFPTINYGENCDTLGTPYIGKCDFDGAGAAFQHIYKTTTLNPPVTAVDSNLMPFSQLGFFSGTQTSLGEEGFIYVPTACQKGAKCHLHIALHGCLMTMDTIGDQFARHAGYNTWAEANNIIVLYPYAKISEHYPTNPNGCWDWWGYTNRNYTIKKGVQIQFILSLIQAVTGRTDLLTEEQR